ncbi:MAG TPA: hypothetical protein VGB90_09625 [Alphaproteobacteria bacterium]|jgi:hypothetical protein
MTEAADSRAEVTRLIAIDRVGRPPLHVGTMALGVICAWTEDERGKVTACETQTVDGAIARAVETLETGTSGAARELALAVIALAGEGNRHVVRLAPPRPPKARHG